MQKKNSENHFLWLIKLILWSHFNNPFSSPRPGPLSSRPLSVQLNYLGPFDEQRKKLIQTEIFQTLSRVACFVNMFPCLPCRLLRFIVGKVDSRNSASTTRSGILESYGNFVDSFSDDRPTDIAVCKLKRTKMSIRVFKEIIHI